MVMKRLDGTTEINFDYSPSAGILQNFTYVGGNASFGINSNGSLGVILGSGDSPEAPGFYDLASRITSGLSGTITRTMERNPSKTTYLVGVTNTSNSNIDIKEIGLYRTVAQNVQTLIDRSLVTPAITLEPGESCSIEYTIEIPSISGLDDIFG
jgi:hypothetical protein